MIRQGVGIVFLIGIFFWLNCNQEPAEITAAHILVMYEGSMRAPESVTRSKEEAEAFAGELLQQIKDGADFQELAKKHSDGPSKVNGGVLTPFGRGKMAPAFEEAAFALKKEEVSGIVETDFGFHIIKRLK